MIKNYLLKPQDDDRFLHVLASSRKEAVCVFGNVLGLQLTLKYPDKPQEATYRMAV